jgi:3-oxoacyl-[acyl-carrier protein] reductase
MKPSRNRSTETVADERVIVITGAGSGVGAAVATGAAREGTSLVLHTGGGHPDSQGRLEAVADRCRQAGAACVTLVGDLAEAGRGGECVELAFSSFGRVDQVVHAAGLVRKSPFGVLTRAELDLCMSAMPGAFLELVTAALPGLEQARHGRVVVVSSFTARKFDSYSLAPASSAAKAAMEVLAKCLAFQLASRGTTVNCVSPGYIRKDPGRLGTLSEEGWAMAAERAQTRRLAAPEEIAATILFLLTPAARQITGVTINVDGGLTL